MGIPEHPWPRFAREALRNALVVEFNLRRIPVEQQKPFPVIDKQHTIPEFIPDMIAHHSIIVDTNVINSMTDHKRGQMLNYLKVADLRVGLILNFKRSKLEWERIVL
jgi:GxxExxY protein